MFIKSEGQYYKFWDEAIKICKEYPCGYEYLMKLFVFTFLHNSYHIFQIMLGWQNVDSWLLCKPSPINNAWKLFKEKKR